MASCSVESYKSMKERLPSFNPGVPPSDGDPLIPGRVWKDLQNLFYCTCQLQDLLLSNCNFMLEDCKAVAVLGCTPLVCGLFPLCTVHTAALQSPQTVLLLPRNPREALSGISLPHSAHPTSTMYLLCTPSPRPASLLQTDILSAGLIRMRSELCLGRKGISNQTMKRLPRHRAVRLA